MRPRIALIAASLDIVGGQGIQARTLAKKLQAEGFDLAFIPINPRFPSRLEWLRRWPYLRTFLNQALYLPSLRRLREADVIHILSAAYWSFLLAPAPAILAARRYGKRVVLNYHSGEAEDHLERWGALVHPWLRMADEIVVPSDYLRRVFGRYGYQARVIRNIVDVSEFQCRERIPLRPHLFSNRNLESHYGVDNTLKAFSLVRKRFPDATLTIAGYGSEEKSLRQLAETIGKEGIRFVGRVEPKAMAGLYGKADIFVNSSVIDNQPVSVLEAFASGLPVVSTGTGDIANMVRDGENGVIIPQRDPSAMAKAVVMLLENPERARDIARRARQEVRKYSWSEVGKEWAAVYSGREA